MSSRMTREPERSVRVFLRYAPEDEAFKQEFETYLILLQQDQLISGWVERQAQRGMDWSQPADPDMLAADLIFLLVSPNLLATGYCSGTEFREVFERNKTQEKAVLIPVSLYPVPLHGHPLASIAFTPPKPVSSWPNRYEAWQFAYWSIRHAIVDRWRV